MAQTQMFDIKIPEGHNVQFNQEATYENFIGQFQQYCSKLLCIIDGTSLRYYDKTSSLPTSVRFDYKQRRGNMTEYYFRDINDDTLYCVFGREAAAVFYPRIDIVDPITVHETSTTRSLLHNNASTKEHPVEYQTKTNTNANQSLVSNVSDICKAKRPPLIQHIKTSIPLFREVEVQDLSNKRNQSRNSEIVIIDEGVKLLFPNYNYPVEIKTFRSS